jgi:AraC-like DNA-binding protein
LHGNFHRLGFSVEWHDLTLTRPLNWGATFHAEGIEICLNLSGEGRIWVSSGDALHLAPDTAAFYGRRQTPLRAERAGGQRHQFVTIELSLAFLRRHHAAATGWHPAVRRLMSGRARAVLSQPVRLNQAHRLLLAGLRHPPSPAGAARLWYLAKVLEAASLFLLSPGPEGGEDAGASRLQRLNQERALAVAAYLREHLSEPVTLEHIGRKVGVSPCYLSRIFAQTMGCGIFQYLRNLRLERAAEMLREGRRNVTEVALEVGYSSLSHFSQAFRERFGCCPGLYPIQTPVQKSAVKAAPPPP